MLVGELLAEFKIDRAMKKFKKPSAVPPRSKTCDQTVQVRLKRVPQCL
jgi:hypothetical protein